MRLKLYLIILISLLLMPIVLSQDIRFYGKQNENLSVRDTCSIQGISCGNTFNCNFTISYPNQTILINQGIGTQIADYWNYTLDQGNTSITGIYETTVYCFNGSNGGIDTFYYQITKDGNPLPSGIWGVVLIAGILGIIGLFIYIAINLDDKFYFIKFLFLLMVFILFSIAFYIARELAMTNYPTTLGEIFDIVFWVYLYLMLFILLIIFTMFIVNLFRKEKEEEIYD